MGSLNAPEKDSRPANTYISSYTLRSFTSSLSNNYFFRLSPTMRASTTAMLASLLPSALAVWNPKICSGSGGCLDITWWPGTAFNCPDGTSLTAQKIAQETLSLETGNYDVIAAAEFPKTCLRNISVPEGASLVG